jgi:hypothetical protein
MIILTFKMQSGLRWLDRLWCTHCWEEGVVRTAKLHCSERKFGLPRTATVPVPVASLPPTVSAITARGRLFGGKLELENVARKIYTEVYVGPTGTSTVRVLSVPYSYYTGIVRTNAVTCDQP